MDFQQSEKKEIDQHHEQWADHGPEKSQGGPLITDPQISQDHIPDQAPPSG